MRTPDEILNDLDSFAGTQDELAQLHELVWEVIDDLLDSLGRYSSWAYVNLTPDGIVAECKAMLTDYVTNAYGDD